MSSSVKQFVSLLARRPDSQHVFNPYAGRGRTAVVCRHNLRLYLHTMRERRPTRLLVGEALGYRGGCLSGIPFTSERLLAEGKGPVPLLEPGEFFRLGSNKTPTAEQTATIVWQVCEELDPLPLLWNAFPFHPHRPGAPQSNRAPTAAERREGGEVLLQLLELFEHPALIAIGRQAERTLQLFELSHQSLRHPARGGKPAFVQGVRVLWGEGVE